MNVLIAYRPLLSWTTMLANKVKGDFNLDDINTIDRFFDRTKLKTAFVYQWLKKERQESMSRSTDPIFIPVKKHFADYLDRRIEIMRFYIQGTDQTKENLPFSSNALQNLSTDDAKKKELLESKLQIQDLLFSCKEVIYYLHTDANAVVQEQLIPFINTQLPAYLKSITPSLPEASKEQITESLVKLKELMLTNNFQEAQRQFTLVETQLMS